MYYRLPILLMIAWSAPTILLSQVSNSYQKYFEEAYQRYPTIPSGLLEAVAYTNSRMQHLRPEEMQPSCQGLPAYYGVMGLIEDGKGYFNNTLPKISRLSGYTIEEIKEDPRINILAYAAAYSALQRSRRLLTRSVENHEPLISELSEIPNDNTDHNNFAKDQHFYSILKEMEEPHTTTTTRSNQKFNYRRIFGTERFQLLDASSLEIRTNRNIPNEVLPFDEESSPFRCTRVERQADFPGAVWATANTRNYGPRNGNPILQVAIHTIQGSYASAISWFKNPNARVSAHYIIRAMDGQITQMVCENDQAYHVRTSNNTSIGIEHEGFIDDGVAWYTPEMYENSAALVRDIAQRHGIDPLKLFGGPATDGLRTLSNACYRIKGHQHFEDNTHTDPGPHWDWDRYYRLVNGKPEVQRFTNAQGNVKQLNYDNLTRRAYLIDPPGNSPVVLRFTEFDLEGSVNNPFDYIDVYDGPDENGRKLGRFSGTQSPGNLVANSGKAYIEFRSDCQVSKRGWALDYTISNVNLDCPPLQNFEVINTFALGAQMRWQGNTNAKEYVIKVRRDNTSMPWRQFQSQESEFIVSGLGANSSYEWEIQSICGVDMVSPPVGGKFTTPSIGRVGSPKVYIIPSEKGKFTDSGGEIAGYTTEEAFIYSIRLTKPGRIKLTFDVFDTEAEYDILTLYDGQNTNARVIGNYSGELQPFSVVSSGNALTAKFVSDKRTESRGWSANWELMAPGDEVDRPDNQIPSNGVFNPQLTYSPVAPTTRPLLVNEYRGNMNVTFDDQNRIGREIDTRFYLVSQYEAGNWVGNPEAGFFFDTFTKGYVQDWKPVNGRWIVNNDRLFQLDESTSNSNIYAYLNQQSGQSYLYHWQARMEGSNTNQRSGLHFFADDPEATQRGTSYFVWFRNTDTGDKVEIYKTVDNRFDLKMEKRISLKDGGVYDYKTVYNPNNGRIEVYINNEFVISWTDPDPIKKGEAISIRSGDCRLEVDNLSVYQSRGPAARVTAGPQQDNDIIVDQSDRAGKRFSIHSVVLDPPTNTQSRWSEVSQAESRVFLAVSPQPENDVDVPTDENILRSSYNDDFMLDLSEAGYFVLPANYDGRRWSANQTLGFFYDDFDRIGLASHWSPISGNWIQESGHLLQNDERNTNSNVSALLSQFAGEVYLYHWKTKIVTRGDNKRFGLHFFASDGNQSNRGDSYLVWFRNHTERADKVELYKSEANQLNIPKKEAPIELSEDRWYDCKVLFDSGMGLIEVYLNDRMVLNWEDTDSLFAKGAYISLRTGSAKVQFDDLRVYKQFPTPNPIITVGTRPTDMVRFRSAGNQPALRVFLTAPQSATDWGVVEMGEAKIQ